MAEPVEAYWWVLAIALVLGIIVAWWLLVANRRTHVEREPEPEEQAAPKRNQALIDAPPASVGGLKSAETMRRDASPAATSPDGPGTATTAAAAPSRDHVPPTSVPPPPPHSSPTPSPPPAAAPIRDIPKASPFDERGASEPATSPTAARSSSPPVTTMPPPVDTAPPIDEPQVARTPPAATVIGLAPTDAPGNALTRIKGLGPKLASELNALGVTGLEQIASWDEAEIDRIDAQLGRFQGRIRRDQWPEQARLLTAGDDAAYEARFGKL